MEDILKINVNMNTKRYECKLVRTAQTPFWPYVLYFHVFACFK